MAMALAKPRFLKRNISLEHAIGEDLALEVAPGQHVDDVKHLEHGDEDGGGHRDDGPRIEGMMIRKKT